MTWRWWLIGAGAMAVTVLLAGLLTLQSDWFRNKVRERIVSEIEHGTGGRAEIGSFRYDWRKLTAEISPFVLHGKEPAGDPPLFRAERIQIGLKVLSVLEKKVDVQEVQVDQPQAHVTVAPDGVSNIPVPQHDSAYHGLIQRLLDLRIRHFALRRGFFDYNEARLPLDLQGDDLTAEVGYAAAGPEYTGKVTARQLRGQFPKLSGPLACDFSGVLALRDDRLEVRSAELKRGGSRVEFTGNITNYAAPRGDFTIQSKLLSEDLSGSFPLPRGAGINYAGRGWFHTFPFSYGLSGDLDGRAGDLTLASPIEVEPQKVTLPRAQIKALGGTFRGALIMTDGRRLALQGVAERFPVEQLLRVAAQKLEGMGGTVSGPVKASGYLTSRGVEDLLVEAKVELTPGETGLPLAGTVNVNFNQRSGKVVLDSSQLALGSTQMAVSGTIGESVQWNVESHNLNELLSVLNVAGRRLKNPLPVELKNGSARFEGTVTGPVSDSHVAGSAQLTNFVYQGQTIDRFSSQVDLTRSQLELRSFSVDQGSLHLQGPSATLRLVDWSATDSSAVDASITATGIPLSRIAGDGLKVAGLASGSFSIGGTLGNPEGTGSLQAAEVEVDSETIARASAQLIYSQHTLTISKGDISAAQGRIAVSGSYRHDDGDWRTGQIRFTLNATAMALASIQHVQNIHEGIRGQTGGKAAGSAKMTHGVFDLVSLEAEGSVRDIIVDNHPYGTIALRADTGVDTGHATLQVEGHADLHGAQLTGVGQWQLTGDYPGTAQIEIPHLTLATLHDLSPGEHTREKLPFDGYVQGTVRIEGELKKPDSLRATAVLDAVQINADPSAKPLAGVLAKDLVIRNAKPVLLYGTSKAIEIQSAEFAAKDTTVRATGRFALDLKSAWDLKLAGNVNVAILQLFNPDLLGSGSSVISATIRGTYDQPDIDGRMELKNASLFLKDVPNGIDEANGVILFDRNRATIQNLSATTGGGKVIFQTGSFLGFRGQTVTYQLLAEAQDVRYRSLDGLSITVAANLSLVGTSESSVLSGTVTVLRAGLSARTDIGSLLAATARPISTPANPSEYLRGLQFDIRLLTAQSLQLQTSLTRDVQAEANLRIRGNSFKPVVLGNITVNAGEIDFFGNRYSITRGEVSFVNPAKIDPILDMDLETKVRGITVDIRFSGPLNKLNFSYRSDPPFEPNQIIALLAVGRVPTATGGLATTQTGATSNFLATSSNELVSQAIAPSNGRLERFFGVSHIKIDPQFTDVTAIPQARLTLEQQISKEVTLTYLTNLQRAQEQLIRVEWDLSRQWAVVALRDESGAFGLDVQYKKRFK